MKKYLLMMLTTGAVAVIPLISEATAAPTASNLGRRHRHRTHARRFPRHRQSNGCSALSSMHCDGGATRPDVRHKGFAWRRPDRYDGHLQGGVRRCILLARVCKLGCTKLTRDP
jgi:hypothetical protein